MNLRLGLAVVALLFLTMGCGAPADIKGVWAAVEDNKSTTAAFGDDGHYIFEEQGQPVAFGSYQYDKGLLSLDFLGLQTWKMSAKLVSNDELELSDEKAVGAVVHFKRIAGIEKARDYIAEGKNRVFASSGGLASPSSGPFSGSVPAAPVERRDLTTCLSNLKQVALAANIYATDYDNAMPPAGDWQERLYPYSKTNAIFTCPTLKNQGQSEGYAYNSAVAGVLMTSLASPASTIGFFETAMIGHDYSADPATSLLGTPRHEKVGVAYADGHAKAQ